MLNSESINVCWLGGKVEILHDDDKGWWTLIKYNRNPLNPTSFNQHSLDPLWNALPDVHSRPSAFREWTVYSNVTYVLLLLLVNLCAWKSQWQLFQTYYDIWTYHYIYTIKLNIIYSHDI